MGTKQLRYFLAPLNSNVRAKNNMNYRDAVTQDLVQIENLLKKYNLPVNDISEYIDNFVISEEENKIIGVGGYETHEEIALIRSIAVAQEFRGKSIGVNIYYLLEKKIKHIGIKEVYLLTETAADYFKKLGFTIKERTNTPKAVMQTKQFKEICPSTAIVMFNRLAVNNV